MITPLAVAPSAAMNVPKSTNETNDMAGRASGGACRGPRVPTRKAGGNRAGFARFDWRGVGVTGDGNAPAGRAGGIGRGLRNLDRSRPKPNRPVRTAWVEGNGSRP